jgi:chromate transporter
VIVDSTLETAPHEVQGSPLEVFFVALKLGLTSFGGPVAHLGYFYDEYVGRRKWLTSETYAEVVAIAQALPGPASSQTGIAVGMLRAGYLGGLMAWIGFTLPSALALIAFGYGVNEIGDVSQADWLHGLKIAAVAIVALAVWSMARSLAPDRVRATIAIAAAILVLTWETAFAQVAVIAIAGVIGWRLFRDLPPPGGASLFSPVGRNAGMFALTVFFILLAGLPVLAAAADSHPLDVIDSFYRTGSLVFGGGHVVLPLLEREAVAPGWVSQDDFLAGYGAAQAVPGPLFTFSAYLGTVMGPEPNGAPGGFLALGAIFLPSFLLIIGGMPLWGLLRSKPAFQASLRGVNAAVVGLLLAALYTPVWTSAILEASDFAIGMACFGFLAFWKAPPWAVVLFAAVAAEVVSRL